MTMPQVGLQLVVQNASQYVQQLNTAGTANQQFAASTTNAANQFAKDASTFSKPASALQEIWVGALRNIGSIVTNQLAELGSKISGFVMQTPMMYADFQDKMQQLGAAAGLTDAQIKPFEDLVLLLGKELPVSTAETAQAAIEMVKGGIDPAIIKLGGLRDVLNFANANMMGLEESANMMAKTVGTFTSATATAEEQQRFMAEAMDYTTKVGNASTYTTQELMLGMLEAGGTAKAVGLEYGEFAVTMGALSPAFSSANVAGTSFKNFLLRLSPTSKEAYDQMKKMGLVTGDATKYMETLSKFGIEPASNDIGQLTDQLYDYMKNTAGMTESEIDKTFRELSQSAFYANGELKDMADISQVLQDATAGLTSEEKSYAMAKIFGNEAMNAAVRLMEIGSEGYNKFATTVQNANGITEQAAATQRGLEFEMEQVQGTLDALGISMGKLTSGVMEQYYKMQNRILGTLLDFTMALNGNREAYNNLSAPFKSLISNINTVITAYNSLTNISYNPTGGFYSLPLVIQDIVLRLRELQKWFNSASASGGTFSQAWEYLLNIGRQLGNYFLSLAPALEPLSSAFQYVGASVSRMGKLINDTFFQNTKTIGSTTDTWVPLLTSAIKTIVSIISVALILITSLIERFVTYATKWWQQYGNEVVTITKFFTTAMTGFFNILLTTIHTIINILISIANKDFKGVFQAISTWLQTLGTTLYNTLRNMLSIMLSYLANEFPRFASTFKAIWDFAKLGRDLVAGFIIGIKDQTANAIKQMTEFGKQIINALKSALGIKSPSKEMMKIGVDTADGFKLGIEHVYPQIEKLMNDISFTVQAIPQRYVAQQANQITYNNSYNLGVNTRASASEVTQSFAIMRALSQ